MKMANVETEWIKSLKDDERSIAHGGVMSDMDARKQKVGGEIICKVF